MNIRWDRSTIYEGAVMSEQSGGDITGWMALLLGLGLEKRRISPWPLKYITGLVCWNKPVVTSREKGGDVRRKGPHSQPQLRLRKYAINVGWGGVEWSGRLLSYSGGHGFNSGCVFFVRGKA